jgi:hypothetical protein
MAVDALVLVVDLVVLVLLLFVDDEDFVLDVSGEIGVVE